MDAAARRRNDDGCVASVDPPHEWLWIVARRAFRVGAIPSSSTTAWKEENTRLAMLVGARLRGARAAAGLSQEALARIARLHRTEIGGLERGGRVPSLHTLLICADVLGVTVGDLTHDLPVPQERRSRVGEKRDVPATATWPPVRARPD